MSYDFDTLWAEYEPVVNGIAQQFGAKGMRWGADHDDFRQEMSVWIFRNIAKLSAKAGEIGDPDSFKKWLAKSLHNQSKTHLSRITAQARGRDADRYYYSVGELKTLLPSIFDPEAKFNPPKFGGDDRHRRDPAHGNNWLVTLADVETGYAKLSLEDQHLLALFHKDGWRNKDLASAWNLSEAQMSSRHTRAVEKLLDQLGGPKPDPMRSDVPGDPFRGRKAVSNAQARAMTSSNYEE